MTRLCVPIIVDSDIVAMQRTALLAAEAGADLLELRLDEFPASDSTALAMLRGFLRTAPLPCILTCRPTWEGGRSKLDDRERFALLNDLSKHQAAYIDLEFAAVSSVDLTMMRLPVILSSHDFDGRPDRLTNRILEMNAVPAEVTKIAWKARTIRDNLEAFELLGMRQRPTIALCMGEAGLISRVLAKKFGAFLTFVSFDRGHESAPGQITIADMKRLYRWDALNPRTKVFGVVGSPIAHSMSPAIHNAAFEQIGFDGIYLPLLVNEGYESFKAFMESFLAFKPLDLSGLSITIPHKENALRFLKERGAEVEELAQRIGAVNTILIENDGSLRGRNTDYAAILDSITSALNITREQLAGYRIGQRWLSTIAPTPDPRRWPRNLPGELAKSSLLRWRNCATVAVRSISTPPRSECTRTSTRARWEFSSQTSLAIHSLSTRSIIRREPNSWSKLKPQAPRRCPASKCFCDRPPANFKHGLGSPRRWIQCGKLSKAG
jgi:3-dehydroquinate dehydratase/shikimate dehydrogenase